MYQYWLARHHSCVMAGVMEDSYSVANKKPNISRCQRHSDSHAKRSAQAACASPKGSVPLQIDEQHRLNFTLEFRWQGEYPRIWSPGQVSEFIFSLDSQNLWDRRFQPSLTLISRPQNIPVCMLGHFYPFGSASPLHIQHPTPLACIHFLYRQKRRSKIWEAPPCYIRIW